MIAYLTLWQFANDFIASVPSAKSSARRAITIKPHAQGQNHWMKVLTVPKEELGIARRRSTTKSGCSNGIVQNWSLRASWIERGPPIWYNGLRPPLWPPLPRELFSIIVACPN